MKVKRKGKKRPYKTHKERFDNWFKHEKRKGLTGFHVTIFNMKD